MKYVGLDAVRQHFVARANAQLERGALVPAIRTYETLLERFPEDERNWNVELQKQILTERVDASKRFYILSQSTASEGAYASSYFFLKSAVSLWQANQQAASKLKVAEAQIGENNNALRAISLACQVGEYTEAIQLAAEAENLWLNIPPSLTKDSLKRQTSLDVEFCESRMNRRVMNDSKNL